MNILVTGANGQLGMELRKIKSSNSSHNFIFTDVEELDITDGFALDNFFAANEIHIVVNCAAYTNVDKAETETDKAILVNKTAAEYLGRSCKKYKALLIHISTDYVFEGTACVPYVETFPLNPVSAYGKSKLLGEQAVIASECNYIIIRTSWLYSEFGANFLKTMLRLGKEKQCISVVYDQIGSPTYAADLAYVIAEKIIPGYKRESLSEIFHFSNEGVCSWFDFASEIMLAQGLPCVVYPILSEEYPLPATRPSFSVLNKAKIKKAYNLTIPHWRTSMNECLKRIN